MAESSFKQLTVARRREKDFASLEKKIRFRDNTEVPQKETRKLGKVTPEVAQRIKSFPHQDNCRILTKDDIRKYGKRPEDIDAKALS